VRFSCLASSSDNVPIFSGLFPKRLIETVLDVNIVFLLLTDVEFVMIQKKNVKYFAMQGVVCIFVLLF